MQEWPEPEFIEEIISESIPSTSTMTTTPSTTIDLLNQEPGTPIIVPLDAAQLELVEVTLDDITTKSIARLNNCLGVKRLNTLATTNKANVIQKLQKMQKLVDNTKKLKYIKNLVEEYDEHKIVNKEKVEKLNHWDKLEQGSAGTIGNLTFNITEKNIDLYIDYLKALVDTADKKYNLIKNIDSEGTRVTRIATAGYYECPICQEVLRVDEFVYSSACMHCLCKECFKTMEPMQRSKCNICRIPWTSVRYIKRRNNNLLLKKVSVMENGMD